MSDNESLPNKYRPKTWDDFIGNETTVASLKSILSRKKGKHHVFLLEGPSGCGKTTLAKIVCRELNCDTDLDCHDYDIAQTGGIDVARKIKESVKFPPLSNEENATKIYILNECHMGTKQFWNGILDVTEFPPDYVYFILCTTEPQKVIPTIRNQRAQVFPVDRLTRPVMIPFLKSIAEKEEVDFPDKFYKEIHSVSEGSPRAALNIMDKIIDIEDDEQAFAAIAISNVDEIEVKKLIDFLMGPGKKSWKNAATILKGLDLTGGKPEEVRQAIAKYFGSVLLNKGDTWTHTVMTVFCGEPWFYSGREKLFDAIYELCRR